MLAGPEVPLLVERLTAQLLAGAPAAGPVAVTERLLAVQAQDERGFRLAIRARSEAGGSARDIDRALSEDRSLLIAWLNRGTLHLVSRDDYPWLHALTSPPLLTGTARRLAQEGVSPDAAERALAVIERSLSSEGPLTRAQLGERIAAAGVRTEGQALVHLLGLAGHRGLVVRGPVIDGRHAFVLVRDWIGPAAPVPRESALAELARRYLAGHGPADERDLARWSGLPLRDARAGLRAIASELRDRGDGLASLAAARSEPAERRPLSAAPSRAAERCPLAAPSEPTRVPPPRLLGAFDPVLLGWRSREFVVGAHERAIVSGGVFRAFALVDGVAAGLWRIDRRGDVQIEPFDKLEPADATALRADGKDAIRYLTSGQT
jgi:hypothetical protein